METAEQALRYIFILSLVLILVAYWAGTQQLISTSGSTLGSLGNIFTGRDAQGKFAAYPSGVSG